MEINPKLELRAELTFRNNSTQVKSEGITPFPKEDAFIPKFVNQLRLNIWRRYCELSHSPSEVAKLLLIPMFFFTLVILLYMQLAFMFQLGVVRPGYFEHFFVIMGFWILIIKSTAYLINDKNSKIKESMKMMGLMDSAYYAGLFITDGILLGLLLSLTCALFGLYSTNGYPPGPPVYAYFNGAPFGNVLTLCLSFCISAVPFSLFMSSFFDSNGIGNNVLIFVLLAIYATNIGKMFQISDADGVVDVVASRNAHTVASLMPTYALQIGCQSLSYPDNLEYPTIDTLCAMLIFDSVLYTFLAWYLSNVLPSEFGISKHPLFLFRYTYWYGEADNVTHVIESGAGTGVGANDADTVNLPITGLNAEEGVAGDNYGPGGIPIEKVDEKYLGRPTVVLKNLRKTFGSQVAVNDLSFSMYEGQIFALLGHNGAGKTTTINMLTGQMATDSSSRNPSTGEETGAWVHGHSIHTGMDNIRKSMGVCPQHDVLFDGLTVLEHIIFFAMLKGATADAAFKEAFTLAKLFHLERRLNHLGSELSGGQKRKLSVAIAVCAGSKFVILDEPTAGMDPLARRELWDLLSELRKGRTILLTTHYMDECNVLGDRTAIINLGGLACLGSNSFLKQKFGAGYKLTCDAKGQTKEQSEALNDFLNATIPGTYAGTSTKVTGEDASITYVLPFNAVSKFESFFSVFSEASTRHEQFGVHDYGISIPSLEDVFLAVGGDHSVTPTGGEKGMDIINSTSRNSGIGSSKKFVPNMISQILAIAARRWSHAWHDVVTIPTLLLPMGAAVGAAWLYASTIVLVSGDTSLDIALNLILKSFLVGLIYYAGFLTVPGLLVQFLIQERDVKLRNVLTVMGCDFRAFWIGNLVADYLLLMIPMTFVFVTWAFSGVTPIANAHSGQAFGLMIIFLFHMISFSYICSFFFSSAKSAAAFMPIIILCLFIAPVVLLLISLTLLMFIGVQIEGGIDLFAYILYGVCLFSPHGALLVGFMNTISFLGDVFPPGIYPDYPTVLIIMLSQGVFFLALAYYFDSDAVRIINPTTDEHFDPHVLEHLHPDVIAERERTLNCRDEETGKVTGPLGAALVVNRLRKVFPSKNGIHGSDVVAAEDVVFAVRPGECFGLLGANGAGKSTTISMCTRHLIPTSGDATVSGFSVLTDFTLAAQNLGVVTQNNSLWDLLTVEDHLRLFARLRGVPEDVLPTLVNATLDQMELRPHAHKLACNLSGGMKRKLCVSISLIGDPSVVLLDEPSAGLDPKSRRNLWNVILQTMSHRAVVLTTHSLEEAEALCGQIAIMVRGQIRVIGSHQHLKNNFGGGFEISVKIKMTTVTAINKAVVDVNTLIFQMFPQAKFLSNNGGVLLTYSVPKEYMNIGQAFSVLETAKTSPESQIEEYSVSQPTLEQVFIRTVNEHTPVPGKKVPTPALLRLLKMPPNTTVSYKDALAMVQSYINDHGLKDPANNSKILSDNDLDEVLQVRSRGLCSFYMLSRRLEQCGFVTASASQVMVMEKETRNIISEQPGAEDGLLKSSATSDLDVNTVLDMMEASEDADGQNALAMDRNKYGFTPNFVYYSTCFGCCFGAFCVFLAVTGAINDKNNPDSISDSSRTFLQVCLDLGLFLIIAGLVCCCCMVCPCCKKPQGLEL